MHALPLQCIQIFILKLLSYEKECMKLAWNLVTTFYDHHPRHNEYAK